MTYITNETIRYLREKKRMTQSQLAEKLHVSDKTVSKWETGKGLPDISIVTELADALSVSVAELLTGNVAENRNVSANMKRSVFYVCPVCGNVIHSVGEGAFSCCGIRLPALIAEEADQMHEISLDTIEGEYYVHMDHPMTKDHYISFIAMITDSRMQLEKLYPEQPAQARFRRNGHGMLYAYCNRHGLIVKKI